jgi:hypothetical protein
MDIHGWNRLNYRFPNTVYTSEIKVIVTTLSTVVLNSISKSV